MVQQIPFSGIENPINFRNYLNNGGYQIAQRGTSFADPTDQTFGLDRWGMFNSNDGAATWSQETATPSGVGAYNSMKVTVTSADTSIGSSQYLATWQGIEGQMLRRAGLGTSGSKQLTLSFWVKSSLTGTYCVSLRNAAVNRSFVREYTVSSADTWEKKQVTFDAETSGTWVVTNALSAYLTFALSMGSGFQGTADSWQTSNVTATSNQANLMASTHNWSIANCQLEDGDTASDFENLPFDVELQRCQRYFQNVAKTASSYICNAWYYTDTKAIGIGHLDPEMRATPSLDAANVTDGYVFYAEGSGDNLSDFGLGSSSSQVFVIDNDNNVADTNSAGAAGGFYRGNSVYVYLKSEI